MTPMQIADTALAVIVKDLRSRAGLDNTWDDIDVDTRSEIVRTWRNAIMTAVTDAKVTPEPREIQPPVIDLLRQAHDYIYNMKWRMDLDCETARVLCSQLADVVWPRAQPSPQAEPTEAGICDYCKCSIVAHCSWHNCPHKRQLTKPDAL